MEIAPSEEHSRAIPVLQTPPDRQTPSLHHIDVTQNGNRMLASRTPPARQTVITRGKQRSDHLNLVTWVLFGFYFAVKSVRFT